MSPFLIFGAVAAVGYLIWKKMTEAPSGPPLPPGVQPKPRTPRTSGAGGEITTAPLDLRPASAAAAPRYQWAWTGPGRQSCTDMSTDLAVADSKCAGISRWTNR
jgi:hypothetical protein